jgi:hypothetical protein
MIAETLIFLRTHLDERLRVVLGGDDSAEKVVFPDGDKLDPPVFLPGAVTSVLINIEEERVLRSADPHARVAEDGSRQRVQPDVRLILYILFVARFKQYDVAWQHLAAILEHMQTNRVFEAATTPTLPAGVERLACELVTLTLAEQNELWGTLKASHHPSLLYRVRMLALRDRSAAETAGVGELQLSLRRTP